MQITGEENSCDYNNAEAVIPGQSVQREMSPQQILEEQVIDDTHDAFLVDTGGELGALLVTAEQEFGSRDITFTVWNPAEMEQPIQTFSEEFMMGVAPEFHHVVDADFDGFQDFGYLFYLGNHPIIVITGCGTRRMGNSNTVRLSQKSHRPNLTRSGRWSLAGPAAAVSATASPPFTPIKAENIVAIRPIF